MAQGWDRFHTNGDVFTWMGKFTVDGEVLTWTNNFSQEVLVCTGRSDIVWELLICMKSCHMDGGILKRVSGECFDRHSNHRTFEAVA